MVDRAPSPPPPPLDGTFSSVGQALPLAAQPAQANAIITATAVVLIRRDTLPSAFILNTSLSPTSGDPEFVLRIPVCWHKNSLMNTANPESNMDVGRTL
jgi:hypothetical protein